MSKATTQRDKEKATNADTMKDAAAGEQATKAALTVLKEFYASQGSFVQQVPEMAAYKGNKGCSHRAQGVLRFPGFIRSAGSRDGCVQRQQRLLSPCSRSSTLPRVHSFSRFQRWLRTKATKAALTVLKEFYASQGSFVQQVPEMA